MEAKVTAIPLLYSYPPNYFLTFYYAAVVKFGWKCVIVHYLLVNAKYFVSLGDLGMKSCVDELNNKLQKSKLQPVASLLICNSKFLS